jgi:hypothetical protein
MNFFIGSRREKEPQPLPVEEFHARSMTFAQRLART